MLLVALQATGLAYIHHPLGKAFVLNLPIPFTLAMLSLGHSLDVTNIAGLGLLLVFFQIIRFVFRRWRWPIVAAIAMAVAVHLAAAAVLAAIMPRTASFFWLVSAAVFTAAVCLHRLSPHVVEPGYRTRLPVWVKFPAIALVIFGVVLVKGWIEGFMTAFPMVGIIAAYEGRFVLGTMCRQMPILVFTMLPTMLLIRLLQPWIGFRWALIPAWGVFLCILVPVMRHQWRTYHRQERDVEFGN